LTISLDASYDALSAIFGAVMWCSVITFCWQRLFSLHSENFSGFLLNSEYFISRCLQFYSFHAVVCRYFGAIQILWELPAVDLGISKSVFKIDFLAFSLLFTAKFSSFNISNIDIWFFYDTYFCGSGTEIFYVVWCVLALVLCSPLSCLSYRFTNNPFVHGGEFIKNRVKKYVTRSLMLVLTKKLTDVQMLEWINAPRNNPTSLSIKTVFMFCTPYVPNLVAQQTGRVVDSFLQVWISIVIHIPDVFGKGLRMWWKRWQAVKACQLLEWSYYIYIELVCTAEIDRNSNKAVTSKVNSKIKGIRVFDNGYSLQDNKWMSFSFYFEPQN
jgi:hypothetical protein